MGTPNLPLPDLGGAPPAPFLAPPLNLDAARLRPGGPGPEIMSRQPDAYSALANKQAAQKLLADVRKLCESGREPFEMGWWRIILYFFGRQWINYDFTARQWTDRRFAAWIPRPVTNKVRETYDSIASLFAEVSLDVTGRPNGNTPQNKITADLISSLMPALAEEHDLVDDIFPESDFFNIMLGNTFWHLVYDKDSPANTKEEKAWQCAACQTVSPGSEIAQNKQRCPACNSNDIRAAVDRVSGRQQTVTSVLGGGKTLVVTPMQLLWPMYAKKFSMVDRLVYQTWLPKHEIEELAPETAKMVSWGMAPSNRSLMLYEAIGHQSDIPYNGQSGVASSAAPDVQGEGATIQYLWIKPNKTYPQGVYLPFIGEGTGAIPAYELVMRDTADQNEQSPGNQAMRPIIPYTDQKGNAVWPWVHSRYKPLGGRLLAQGAVDAVLQKQDQINQIDSMTDLTVRRMGNPVWLEEKGAQVERFSGMPGTIVKWQRIGQNGGKPEKLDGTNPPQSFYTLRQQYLGDFEEGTGTYDVIKGTRPSGVSAHSALQLLVERSQSRFNTALKSRGRTYANWAKIAFELERKYGPSERIRNVMGPNRRWVEKTFQQADLQGNVTIIIEDGSTAPKTALGRRAALEHANQMGLVDFTQPDQRYEALQIIGITELVPGLDADVQSALQEQQTIVEWAEQGFPGLLESVQLMAQGPQLDPVTGQPKAPTVMTPFKRMPWHEDQTHFNEHRRWMNSDECKDIFAMLMQDKTLAPFVDLVVQAFGQHLADHEIAAAKKAMLLSMSSGTGGAVAGGGIGRGKDGGGVGAGRALGDSNREASNPQQAEGAV